jgi:hypothetical protein
LDPTTAARAFAESILLGAVAAAGHQTTNNILTEKPIMADVMHEMLLQHFGGCQHQIDTVCGWPLNMTCAKCIETHGKVANSSSCEVGKLPKYCDLYELHTKTMGQGQLHMHVFHVILAIAVVLWIMLLAGRFTVVQQRHRG